MKRLGLIAALLIGCAIPAHADTDIWNNMLKQQRGDDALHVDSAFCDAQLRRAAERHGDLSAIQALHAHAGLALQSYGSREGRRLSRSR
ncbi:hypothetical protein ACVW0J_003512 [Bradyrhizobium sp. i1.7.7]